MIDAAASEAGRALVARRPLVTITCVVCGSTVERRASGGARQLVSCGANACLLKLSRQRKRAAKQPA